MERDSLLLLTTVLWFLTTSVFIVQYLLFKDRMMARLAVAFGLIAIARVIHGYSPFSYDTSYDLALTVRAVSAYFLVIAALNGHRKSQHTDGVLALFLLVSVVSQWFTPAPIVPHPLSLGPITFILTVGWGFLGWKLVFDADSPFEDAAVCKLFGLIAFTRVFVSAMVANSDLLTYHTTLSSALDIVTVSGLLWAGMGLGFYRHRVFMQCERELVGELPKPLV